MPRPRVPKHRQVTEITFVKLLRAERVALNRIHRKRKRELHSRSSRSAIMREAFVFWLKKGGR